MQLHWGQMITPFERRRPGKESPSVEGGGSTLVIAEPVLLGGAVIGEAGEMPEGRNGFRIVANDVRDR
jgi:hypothetical protein